MRSRTPGLTTTGPVAQQRYSAPLRPSETTSDRTIPMGLPRLTPQPTCTKERSPAFPASARDGVGFRSTPRVVMAVPLPTWQASRVETLHTLTLTSFTRIGIPQRAEHVCLDTIPLPPSR